ncbi:MAG: hypothetical protein M0041_01680 [Nitrospiraceae bacterium]|nr:hypothetical protein [Nitrospiraceae bacterium]
MTAPDETVIHAEALHSRSGKDSPVGFLAGLWAVTGVILMGIGMALHAPSGTLLAGMR